MNEKKVPPKTNSPLKKSSNTFPVVGIGASAGGLDAFRKLLKAIPVDSEMAYVLVQHLSPSQESLLPDLLQRVTHIPVLEITDDIHVEPNHIYIIPANKMLIANDGVLQLSPRPSPGKDRRNLPIDIFFSSLAEVHQSHSIGVVLSGTASDGTAGLKAIKDHGGITFAQDEASAEYKEMPRSAVRAGVVDFILSPEKIPEKLLQITKLAKKNGGDEQTSPKGETDVFKQVLSLLRIRKGTDFTYYKDTTLKRRLLRRMVLNDKVQPLDYLNYIRENKTEQDALYQDLLIPVTSFFRDPQSFASLCQIVLSKIATSKTSDEPTRIWVAGCSTGEEAYSIAICLKELSAIKPLNVQIFATDISEPAIAKARSGLYSSNEVTDISPERLREFFTKTNGNFQVNKDIRDMCIFALHNFLKDPPFGRLDLVTCRNVLIYMEPYLQKKALGIFHYALNPKGFLFLGRSESVSPIPDSFASLNNSDKIFTRKDGLGSISGAVISEPREQNFREEGAKAVGEKLRTDFQKTADEFILNKYTPVGVVVNSMMDIVHFRGNTSDYLQQPAGMPSHNLLKLAKNELTFELRNIFHKLKKEASGNGKENQPVIKENIPLKIRGVQQNIGIEAIELSNVAEPHYLILFHHSPPATENTLPSAATTKTDNKLKGADKDLYKRIQQLEQELEQMHEDMRGIADDQEAANEELQSANEELQSGSEELLSLNEELATSKEELQSTNEELTVVNQQLVGLNQQVTEERNFAEAVVTTVREPLVVLDRNLRIKTANKSFLKTFQVNEQEIEGLRIYDLGNNQLDIAELRTLLERVLPERENFSDFEVTYNLQSIGPRTMLLNAREVQRDNGAEKLILLAIEDITETKKTSQIASRLSAIVDSSDDAIVSKTLDGIITTWNKGAEKIFGYRAEEAVGKHITFIIPTEIKQEADILINKIKKGESVEHFETERLAKDGRRINVSLTMSPIKNKEGIVTGASKIARDITEKTTIRKKIEENSKRYHDVLMQSPFAFCIMKGRDLEITLANNLMKQFWGKGNEVEGKTLLQILPEIKDQSFPAMIDSVFTTRKPVYANEMLARLNYNGKMAERYFNIIYQPYLEADETISGVITIAHEVTDQVVARKKMEVQTKLFEDMLMNAPGFVATLTGPDHVYGLVNDQYQSLFGKRKIKGKAIMEALPELEGQGFDKLLDQVYNTGETYVGIDIPITLARDENLAPEKRYFNFSYQPMYDQNKKIFSILVFGYEVTDQVIAKNKNLESQQQRTNELEEKVQQRTLELSSANEALRQKNKELESFAYISSHDLQEPLRKIQTFATRIEEIEGGNLSTKGHDYFQRVKDSAHRMQILIQDLLSYSRTANAERKFIKTDLNKVVGEVKDDLLEIILEKRAIIEIDLHCQVPIIPFQFHQAIYNLLSNSLKFSEKGKSPHIIIKDETGTGSQLQKERPDLENQLVPENSYCHITISDNGIGFEAEYNEKIFEVFQRLFPKGEYPGTGIGLSIVKRIIENHNGIIIATGELNKGATFDIYIAAS